MMRCAVAGGRAHAGAVLDQHGKLVAANARQGVLPPHAGFQAPGHFHQQQIAGAVTETVVDHLEAVEIDEQNRAAKVGVAFEAAQRDVKQVHEERTIAQFGQVVMEGGVKQLVLGAFALLDLGSQGLVCRLRQQRAQIDLFHLLAFGDVTLHRHPMGEPAALVGDRGDAELDPELGAVLAAVEQFDFDRLPGRQCGLQPGQRLAVGSLRLQQPRGASEHFLFGIAGGPGEGGIAIDDPRSGQVDRLGLGDQDGIVGIDHNRFEQAQALQLRMLRGRLLPVDLAPGLQFQHTAELRSMGAQDVGGRAVQAGMRRRVGHHQHAAVLAVAARDRQRGDKPDARMIRPEQAVAFREQFSLVIVVVDDQEAVRTKLHGLGQDPAGAGDLDRPIEAKTRGHPVVGGGVSDIENGHRTVGRMRRAAGQLRQLRRHLRVVGHPIRGVCGMRRRRRKNAHKVLNAQAALTNARRRPKRDANRHRLRNGSLNGRALRLRYARQASLELCEI